MAVKEAPTISPVETLIEEVVERLTSNGPTAPVLRTEAERIAGEVEPEDLVEWARDRVVSMIRERIEVRLALARHENRRSRGVFFAQEEESTNDSVQPLSPFSQRYPCDGRAWKRAGDMLTADWLFVANSRTGELKKNYFVVLLA